MENHQLQIHVTHFTELARDVFEDVAGGVVEEGLQSRQVGALLQDALQSFLTLSEGRKINER